MKRILSLTLCLFMLLCLSACGEPPTVENNFIVSFTVSQGDTDYAGTLTREDGVLNIQINEPYAVKGMAYRFEDGELSIDYGTHSAKASCDYLPANSIPTALFESLTYLPQATYSESNDGEDFFNLPTPYGNATLAARDGIPTSLSGLRSKLEFSFKAI